MKNTNPIILMRETKTHTCKPPKADVPKVRANLVNTEITDTRELAYNLVNEGRTIQPNMASHDGSCKGSDWRSQEIFLLDIDNDPPKDIEENHDKGLMSDEEYQTYLRDTDYPDKILPDDLLRRLAGYHLHPCFIYTSFSDTDYKRKYRLVFRSNTLITIPAIRRAIIEAFRIIVPESDPACTDATRIFFGGKSIIHEDYDATFDPIQLITKSLTDYLYQNDSAHYTRSLEAYCKKAGLNICNQFPDIRPTTKDKYLEEIHESQDSKSGEIALSSIIYNIEFNLNSPKNDISSYDWKWLHDDKFSGKVLYQNWQSAQYYVFNFSKPEKIKKNAKGEIRVTYKPEKRKEDNSQDLIQNFNFETLKTNCQLYRDILNKSYWAWHDELFGISTNFACIKGGEEAFDEVIEANIDGHSENYEAAAIDGWYRQVSYNRNAGDYSPMRCENFCPFKDTCKNRGKNMLSANSKKLNNDIRKLEDSEIDYISLDEATANTQLSIEEAMSADDHKIYCIKAPTGIGKTAIYTQMNLENTCIALPTHALKDEVYGRIPEDMRAKIVCKQEFNSPDPDINAKFKALQSVGAYGEAYNFLSKIHGKEVVYTPGTEMDESDRLKHYIGGYLINMSAMKEASSIITTHANMLHMNNPNIKTVIIDEDITSQLLSITEYMEEDFNTVIHYLVGKYSENDATVKSLRSLIDTITKATANTYIPFPQIKISGMKKINEAISEVASSLTTNIPNILKSQYMIRNVDKNGKQVNVLCAQSNLNLLKDNKTYIILSATLNEDMCRYLFKDRLVFTDIGSVKIDSEENCTTGDIYQWCRYSTSRQAIIKNPDRVFTQITTSIPDIDTNINLITFANCERIFAQHGFTNSICHFGACSGIDAYAGQDLLVVGTPHVSQDMYYLYAKLLGHFVAPIACDDDNMKRQNIIRNGYEFSFMTFDDSFLQTIQLWAIEQELYQAIGRARALRHKCKVYVFCNLPLVNTKVQDCE